MADANQIETDLNSDITFEKIASKLIKEGLLLTALEFHAELIENGKEIPLLRDFFSNPENFEILKNPENFEKSTDEPVIELSSVGPNDGTVLPRTSSVQTFDSLDFARNSDDGECQTIDKIAVLEFELRKARETIKSLRASLTVSTATESAGFSDTAINESSHDFVNFNENVAAKPHEKRSLNFLINEYLMKYNYKLTSITFSDENEDQDFENWDDVGLNIPKPPDLLRLYRYHWWHNSRKIPEL